MFDDHFVDICIGGINCIIISAGVLVILVVFNKEEKRKNASEMYGIHFCFIECFLCFFFLSLHIQSMFIYNSQKPTRI